MNSGIYKIVNKINGKVYIGKTKNFKKRWSQYGYDFKFKRTDHINDHLLNSMVKYGFENFDFSIVEECSLDLCSERELYYIDLYESCDPSKGYNLRRDSSTGMVTHELTSVKISKRLKLEWESGARSQHSDKMKKNWENRDRQKQSNLMTKLLTKYVYVVTDECGVSNSIGYNELCNLGLGNVLATFHKKNTDIVKFKCFIIERIRVDEGKA